MSLEQEIEKILNDTQKNRPLSALPAPANPILNKSYPRARIRTGDRTHTTRPCTNFRDGTCPIFLGESDECHKHRMLGCAFKVLGGGREIDYPRTLRLLTTHRAHLAKWALEARYHPRGIYVFDPRGIPYDGPLGMPPIG